MSEEAPEVPLRPERGVNLDTGVITALSTAANSIKGLIEIPGTITSVKVRNELNTKIAELMDSLIAARQQMLEMQQKYELLLKENIELKQISGPRAKPRLKWGCCYEFDGEEGLFCPACYDERGKKALVIKVLSHFRCTVCRTVLS